MMGSGPADGSAKSVADPDDDLSDMAAVLQMLESGFGVIELEDAVDDRLDPGAGHRPDHVAEHCPIAPDGRTAPLEM